MHNGFKSRIILLRKPPFKLINWQHSENRKMNFHKRGMNKEVRVLTRAKWRICRKYPFISSWLTGACGGGEPKSVLVCSEASANHTWPLPSTLANERWPLGAICCELLQSQQRCASFPDRNTGTHLFEDIQCPREDATSSKRWTQSLIYYAGYLASVN